MCCIILYNLCVGPDERRQHKALDGLKDVYASSLGYERVGDFLFLGDKKQIYLDEDLEQGSYLVIWIKSLKFLVEVVEEHNKVRKRINQFDK